MLKSQKANENIARFADMLTAIGSESRLRITQLLLKAHPEGLVAGEIQAELGVSASNLSHHLEKLKNEGVIEVQREGSFLRYTANTEALQELLAFLFSECCTRSKAIQPEKIIQICSPGKPASRP
jgi:ArsR family transcriptional regulator, arsenate/arsenite/antimonite-responsive transcriptional repressor